MIIGIDIREALGNKTGKGYYTFNLVSKIILDKRFDFILYSDKNTNLFNKNTNVSIKVVGNKGLFWHYKVYKSLKKDKVDLFWAPTSFIIPFLIAKKIDYILTIHDLVSFLFPTWHNKKAVLIEKFTLKRALKYAKKIFVVSKNTANDLEKKFGISKDKMVVTYNSYETRDSRPETRNSQLATRNYIFNIGTLEPRKNQIRLIQAFDLIKDEFSDLELWIGGGKGWCYEKIFEEVVKLKLEKRVKFLGYINEVDLPSFYKNAELFAFPSIYEGFGIPIVEAMSFGCPVLTADNSSLKEVAGDAAVFVNAENIDSIANGLRKILNNEMLKKELIKKGFIQVKKFSWDKSAQSILKEF
jgi:glycosyltransferase involved in cell wall biosynthesis